MQATFPPRSHAHPQFGVRHALRACRSAFWGVALFSAIGNILVLTGPIYMLQLYDRVLTSRSVPTLVGLTLALLILYAAYLAFDILRLRMLTRIGIRLERRLRSQVLAAVAVAPLRTRATESLQPVRDLEHIRSFLSGLGPTALFDFPWMPLYFGLIYIMHPWLGLLGIAGGLVLVGLTMLTEIRGRTPTRDAVALGASRQALSEAVRRNAEAIHALGMRGHLSRRWDDLSERHLTWQVASSDVAGTYGSLTKVTRMVLQSVILGLGAYLVIIDQATAGVMIAASILVSRALAPIEIAIANWRSYIAARQSAERLDKLLPLVAEAGNVMSLPPPKETLSVEDLWVAAPGTQRPTLQSLSFSLKAGDGLAIVGPAAAGKSTLARALVGAWPAQRGVVRLDGAAIDQWPADDFGRHIGYMPQDIELFAGTIAQNISRFDPDASGEAVIAAAAAAGVHDMILRQPNGYQTEIGEGGMILSAGQRQCVALARALYGSPFLVVLDEPNSSLDANGEAALGRAITSVRNRGGIVIVITHRRSALGPLDMLMVLEEGQMRAFGPKADVIRNTFQPVAVHPR